MSDDSEKITGAGGVTLPAPQLFGLARVATFSDFMRVVESERAKGVEYILALYHEDTDTWLEISDARYPRAITSFHIEPLSDDEDRATLAAMVREGWDISATSPEAQEILHAAGIEASTTMLLPAAPASKEAKALTRRPDHVGLERMMARLPVFVARPASGGPVQPSLWQPAFMEGQPFDILEVNGPMGARDALLLGHMTKAFADNGYPDSRSLAFSLNEAARWAGYSDTGGPQRKLVAGALERIWGVSWRSPIVLPNGKGYKLWWRALDNLALPDSPGDPVMVKFNETFAYQILTGQLVHLAADTFADLVNRDEIAALLWVFLESHTFEHKRSYRLFSAPPGQPARQLDTPPIADLVRIGRWKDRGEVAKRIRKAALAVEAIDPHYALAVEPAKEKQVWKLTVQTRSLEGTTDPPDGVLPTPRGGYYRPPEVGTTGPPDSSDSPANGGRLETPKRFTNVLQTSLQMQTGLDLLEKDLEKTFGPALRQSETRGDVEKELAKVADTLRSMMPQHFGGADPEEWEKLVGVLMRYTLDHVAEANPDNPIAYLEAMRQNAISPSGLAGDDGMEFAKARLRANSGRSNGEW